MADFCESGFVQDSIFVTTSFNVICIVSIWVYLYIKKVWWHKLIANDSDWKFLFKPHSRTWQYSPRKFLLNEIDKLINIIFQLIVRFGAISFRPIRFYWSYHVLYMKAVYVLIAQAFVQNPLNLSNFIARVLPLHGLWRIVSNSSILYPISIILLNFISSLIPLSHLQSNLWIVAHVWYTIGNHIFNIWRVPVIKTMNRLYD